MSDRFAFFPIGFHGDHHLLALVDTLMTGVDAFVETGANVGSTLAYVGRRFPHIPCISCEPDPEAFSHARENILGMPHVTLCNDSSPDFLERVWQNDRFRSCRPMFWLDAHGQGYEWPLPREVRFITTHWSSGWILIDDFKVPGLDMFGYDTYNGQECSYEFIAASLAPERSYHLHYPAYTKKTSLHHTLRGWGMLTFGPVPELPPEVQGTIHRAF